MIEMADICVDDNYLLTPDAAAAGRQATGHCPALSGADTLLAALVDLERTGAEPCRSTPIPAQHADRKRPTTGLRSFPVPRCDCRTRDCAPVAWDSWDDPLVPVSAPFPQVSSI